MTDVSDKIRALEREMNISQLTPWKVVAGFVAIAGLLIMGCTWWIRPSMIKGEDDQICNKRLFQFCTAVVVGLSSLAWLLWGWYQG